MSLTSVTCNAHCGRNCDWQIVMCALGGRVDVVDDSNPPNNDPMPATDQNMEAVAIIEYLKHWVAFDGHHEMALDQQLLKSFTLLCDLYVAPINSSDAKLMKADVKARIKHARRKVKGDKDKRVYYTKEAPAPREPSKSKHLALENIHPEELARQLTLMEEDIFVQIRPKEFLKQAWNKGNHEVNAPFITMLTRNFNKQINWITTEVLKHSDATLRADTITKFIKTAKYFEQLKNYNGVMQVLSSLHSSAISRLRQSWGLITPKAKAHFDRLTALMSNLSNFKTFRETFSALEPEEPCIPFIAVFLTDCTYLDDTMNDKDDQGRYNWDKLSTMAAKIREIRRFGMRRYNLIPVASIQSYIASAESWNDNKTLYAISQLAEDGSATGEGEKGGTVKPDARKAYSKFNRVTVANMNLKSMYLRTDNTADQNALSQRDWKILLTGATLRTYQDGDVVLEIGTTNNRLFKIKSGMVQVHKNSVDTPPVATMGKEEMFGEISMLLRGEDGTTTAAIVASGVVEIWEIAIDFVLRMCEGDHVLSEKLHRIIATKLAQRLKALNTSKRTKARSSRNRLSNSHQQISSAPSGDGEHHEDDGEKTQEKSSKFKILKMSNASTDGSAAEKKPEEPVNGKAAKRRSLMKSSDDMEAALNSEANVSASGEDNSSPPLTRSHGVPSRSESSKAIMTRNQIRSSVPPRTEDSITEEEEPDFIPLSGERSPERTVRHVKKTSDDAISTSQDKSSEIGRKSPDRAVRSPDSKRLKRSSTQVSSPGEAKRAPSPGSNQETPAQPTSLGSELNPAPEKPRDRSASPSRTLASWRGRVSAALLPRRSSSDQSGTSSSPTVKIDEPKASDKSDKADKTEKGEKDKKQNLSDAEKQDVAFRKRFKLKENVVLIRAVECAIKGAIVTHGVLYISERYWCFGSSIFGLKTSESVRIETITDIENTGKYLIIKYSSSKVLKLCHFENIEDTYGFVKKLWEKFTKPESDVTVTTSGGTLIRRSSSRFLNRAAILPSADGAAPSAFTAPTAATASSSTAGASSSAQPAAAPTPEVEPPSAEEEEADDVDISSKFELTEQDWSRILKGANLVNFQKGDAVIKEGDTFQRVFQLLKGSACIQKEVNGVMTVLGRLTAEDGIFGEISFLEGGSATASIVADEPDTAVYIIEGYFLNVFFERNPGFSGRFYHFLAHLLSKRIKSREAALAKPIRESASFADLPLAIVPGLHVSGSTPPVESSPLAQSSTPDEVRVSPRGAPSPRSPDRSHSSPLIYSSNPPSPKFQLPPTPSYPPPPFPKSSPPGSPKSPAKPESKSESPEKATVPALSLSQSDNENHSDSASIVTATTVANIRISSPRMEAPSNRSSPSSPRADTPSGSHIEHPSARSPRHIKESSSGSRSSRELPQDRELSESPRKSPQITNSPPQAPTPLSSSSDASEPSLPKVARKKGSEGIAISPAASPRGQQSTSSSPRSTPRDNHDGEEGMPLPGTNTLLMSATPPTTIPPAARAAAQVKKPKRRSNSAALSPALPSRHEHFASSGTIEEE